MSRKQPKYEYTIICDDIRQEFGNKLTFVGTYQNLIIVSKLPYIFPKLCFFVQYKDIRAGDKFSLELTDPLGKRIDKAINMTVPVGPKVGKLRLSAVFSPIKVEKEGRYTLSITVNDNEKKKQEIVFTVREAAKQK